MNIPIFPHPYSKLPWVDVLIKALPDTFYDYWEPFIGGCSVALNLSRIRCSVSRQVYLSDTDTDLINLYKVLVNPFERTQLVDMLEDIDPGCNNDYASMLANPARLSAIERAVLYAHLNNCKTDTQSIIDFVDFLLGVNLFEGDFSYIEPEEGDLVFVDPPEEMHNDDVDRLIDCLEEWNEKEFYVMGTFSIDWYDIFEGWNRTKLRRKSKELLLIRNFGEDLGHTIQKFTKNNFRNGS